MITNVLPPFYGSQCIFIMPKAGDFKTCWVALLANRAMLTKLSNQSTDLHSLH